jgi:hypothetical protein
MDLKKLECSFAYSSKTQPGLRSGFWVLIGLPGRPGYFFKKNKKNKNQRVFNRILLGQPGRRVNPPGHIKFFPSLFFFQPGLIPAPNPESTVGPDFKTMSFTFHK